MHLNRSDVFLFLWKELLSGHGILIDFAVHKVNKKKGTNLQLFSGVLNCFATKVILVAAYALSLFVVLYR